MAGTQTPTHPKAGSPEARAAVAAGNAESARIEAAEEKAAAAKVELDFISGGAILLTSELAKQAAPTNARNDRQRAMDKVVHDAHQQWTRANKPSQWGTLVESKCVVTYFVEPDKSADIKKLVTRAAAFHNVRPRWGTPFKASAELVKRYNLPENYVGREVISFAIMDRRPRAAKS